MKKKSMQQIQDTYINMGYVGEDLRKVLERDKEYQKIFKEKRQKLSRKLKILRKEKKKYVLSTDADFEILAKCKQLEKKRLSREDRFFVKTIKTQLELNWRKPLLKTLNRLLKKYE